MIKLYPSDANFFITKGNNQYKYQGEELRMME